MRLRNAGKSLLSFAFALSAVAPVAIATPAAAQSGRPAFLGTTCNTVTPYGQVQPAAVPPEPPPPPAPPRPAGAARPATPTSFPIPDAPVLPYHPVATAPPAGTLWQGVSEIDVMPNGNLIVFQRSAMNMLLEYDPEGRLLRTFDDNIAARAHGLKVDRHGNIWITDIVCHTVMKLAPSGAVLMTLGTKGVAGTWDEAAGKHLFNQPNEVAFGKDDDFWVVTGHGGGDPRVLHFDANGKFLTSWSMKHQDGSNGTIHSIIVAPNGELWIADRTLKQIIVMDQAGKRLKTIQMQNQVSGLYVDAKGGLWMAGGQDGMLMSLDWNGKITGWTGKLGPGNNANEYTEVHYMAVSPDLKYLYVADSLGNRLDKLQHN
jgi:sugar lactone lactonase YvrE